MRAQLLERPGPGAVLRSVERSDPAPAPDELVLRVEACGVCRTDLQLARGDLAARALPVVPGHQVVGTVEALGTGVRGWREGERAGVTWLGGSCGSCRLCSGGRENLCERAVFTGWDRDGGYAERMAVRAAWAVRLPGGFGAVEAAPLLCGGVIGYRALRLAGLERGQRLGLYGFGASALLTIQVAVHRGLLVHVATRSGRERERARSLGASSWGGYEEAPPAPLDAAITFAPAGEVVIAALAALSPAGSVVVNAIHLDRVPEFPYRLLWGERSLRSVANVTSEDAREFLELAAAIPLRTAVEALPLAQANLALARLERGELEGTGVLVP